MIGPPVSVGKGTLSLPLALEHDNVALIECTIAVPHPALAVGNIVHPVALISAQAYVPVHSVFTLERYGHGSFQ
jgi:hypothetical protein